MVIRIKQNSLKPALLYMPHDPSRISYSCTAEREMTEEQQKTTQRRFFLYTTQPILVPRDVTHVRVDLGVEKIRRCSFQNRDTLVEAILPEGLRAIGDEAFRYCQKIRDVSIPSTVPIIGYGMFFCCSSLVTVHLSEGLREIGSLAFSECSSLINISIPSTTETIGSGAFWYCTSLKNVSLREGLRVISEGAFERCTKLLSVEIPSTVHNIQEGAFLFCGSLTSVKLNEGLVFIGPRVFAGCWSILSLAIPSTTKAIGFRAFKGCSSLLGVEIPKNRALDLDHEVFRGCTNLVNVSIPSTVSPDDLFVECPLLHKVHLDQAAVLERYEYLPVHEGCYRAWLTPDELKARLTLAEADKSPMFDAFGMSPFHVYATCTDIRLDLLEVLLEYYPLETISYKDFNGKTMVDYLFMRNNSKANHRVKVVLKFAALKMVSGWGHERWNLEKFFECGESIHWEPDVWRRKIRKILGVQLPPYLQAEITSTLELVLWKMKIKEAEEVYGCMDRKTCRVVCKPDDVISNVVDFLWSDSMVIIPQEILPHSYYLVSMDGDI